MKIYIPTKGRVNQQKTLEYIPQDWIDRTMVVSPVEEQHLHIQKGRLTLGCPHDGIGNTRQFILDTTSERKVLFIDDDHDFFIRKSSNSHHLRRIEPNEMSDLFHRIEERLDHHAMVGVSARQGNNNYFPEVEQQAVRMCNMYGVDVATLNGNKIRFNDMELMEDFYVQLSLLTRGYSTVCLTDVAWNQSASNAVGGCSTYRTGELQKKAAHQLRDKFPQFVKVVEKTNKTGWDGMKTRTDVIVSWKKAYEHGRNNVRHSR